MPGAALTNDHKPGGLKQHFLIVLAPRNPESVLLGCNQGADSPLLRGSGRILGAASVPWLVATSLLS